jgi:hypothetical protein
MDDQLASIGQILTIFASFGEVERYGGIPPEITKNAHGIS